MLHRRVPAASRSEWAKSKIAQGLKAITHKRVSRVALYEEAPKLAGARRPLRVRGADRT